MKLATLGYLFWNNKTLMLYKNKKRNDIHYGKFSGIGGKFNQGESPEECMVREFFEETGLEIEPTFRGILTEPRFDGINDWYIFVFTSTKFKGNIINSPEGELKWVNNLDLLKLNLWAGDKIFIPWLFENKFFSAKFNYENGEYKGYEVHFY